MKLSQITVCLDRHFFYLYAISYNVAHMRWIVFGSFMVLSACGCPCPANEICLRNQTCHCPFFKLGGACLRQRYQTTVNATFEALQSARHLLGKESMLLTIDSTNYEAMNAIGTVLQGVANIGTVVTSVVDSLDTLIGSEPIATMQISNLTVVGTHALVVIEYRLPLVDFFYFYLHLGTSAPPCPPFDIMGSCCRGMMGIEFRTVGVDCTSDPMAQMNQFIDLWGGVHIDDQHFSINVDLLTVPSTPSGVNGRLHRFGVGMVVFGNLAQNTEARVEVQLNTSASIVSTGFFQFSFVDFARLQLETFGDNHTVFAHLIIKASNVTAVQNLLIGTSEDGPLLPLSNCSVLVNVSCPTISTWQMVSACNITIDPEFIDISILLSAVAPNTLVYVLLSRGTSLARVLVKTDATVMQRCPKPIVQVEPSSQDGFIVQVFQQGSMLYSGPTQLVNLTEVALLTLRISTNSSVWQYTFDNISVVYSLVDASRILDLMVRGKVTPALEALCDDGSTCIIEQLLLKGVCQTDSKCEWQGSDLVVMPLYPWGVASLKNGACTVLLTDIKEEVHIAPGVVLAGEDGWFADWFRR